MATPEHAPIPEESYEEIEEFLGSQRDTPEFQFRLDGIRKMLADAAQGPFIPIEDLSPEYLQGWIQKNVVEWGLAHPEEVEEHRKELEFYGFA